MNKRWFSVIVHRLSANNKAEKAAMLVLKKYDRKLIVNCRKDSDLDDFKKNLQLDIDKINKEYNRCKDITIDWEAHELFEGDVHVFIAGTNSTILTMFIYRVEEDF
jgi:GTP-dependent phosphoenolpyruvate carboxykinase